MLYTVGCIVSLRTVVNFNTRPSLNVIRLLLRMKKALWHRILHLTLPTLKRVACISINVSEYNIGYCVLSFYRLTYNNSHIFSYIRKFVFRFACYGTQCHSNMFKQKKKTKPFKQKRKNERK